MNNLATIGQYLNNMHQSINALGAKVNTISSDFSELIQRVKRLKRNILLNKKIQLKKQISRTSNKISLRKLIKG